MNLHSVSIPAGWGVAAPASAAAEPAEPAEPAEQNVQRLERALSMVKT